MRALACLTLAASLLACDEEYGPGPATPIILTSPPVHAVPLPPTPLTREPVQAVVPPAPKLDPAVVAPAAPEPVVEPAANPKPVVAKKKKKTVKR